MMRAVFGLTFMVCAALGSAGCSMSNPFNRNAGFSTEFIAGNATSVLIDYAHGSDSELDAAHTLAVNRCTLFGRNAAVLDSINPRGDGKDRASFLCQ